MIPNKQEQQLWRLCIRHLQHRHHASSSERFSGGKGKGQGKGNNHGNTWARRCTYGYYHLGIFLFFFTLFSSSGSMAWRGVQDITGIGTGIVSSDVVGMGC
jgi:hypothetical protein